MDIVTDIGNRKFLIFKQHKNFETQAPEYELRKQSTNSENGKWKLANLDLHRGWHDINIQFLLFMKPNTNNVISKEKSTAESGPAAKQTEYPL